LKALALGAAQPTVAAQGVARDLARFVPEEERK